MINIGAEFNFEIIAIDVNTELSECLCSISAIRKEKKKYNKPY
jgi:hypothetical protein